MQGTSWSRRVDFPWVVSYYGCTLPTQRSRTIPTLADPALSRHYTLDEAFAYCAAVTRAHYENFPVASLFMPEEKRPYITAIYAFSRAADDMADEGDLAPAERLRLLDDWGDKLEQAVRGEATHPIFIALADTMRSLQLPPELLRDLLSAFRRDVTQTRYDTFEDLLSYCRTSANPVGRLVLQIFGQYDDPSLALSDDLCTALQLTNFWQDVAVDRAKGRCYIPLEDMTAHGYTEASWARGVEDDAYRTLLAFEAARTKELFYRAAPLPSLVVKDLQIELRLIWFGGMRILRRLERNGYRGRPVLTGTDKFRILVNGLFRTDLSRYGRKRTLEEMA
jgi:phytoene synthase